MWSATGAMMNSLDNCHSIYDLKALAKSKLPKPIFDYIEGGAEDEQTLNRNRNSFSDYQFVPRILKDVSNIDMSTQIQGIDIKSPVVIAPTGMSRMFHYQGEEAVCRAARNANTIYSLSTVSTCSIEQIADASKGPKFFQVYAWKNRKMITDFIQRCQKNNYDAILLAVDLAALGKREKDLHNGHGNPIKLRLNTAFSALTKPAWLYRFITSPKLAMANMLDFFPQASDAFKTLDSVNEQFDPTITWEDAKLIKEQWKGPFWLKGIQSVEDAILAAEMGVTGIILSNHGGRQLDGAPSAIDILPEVVKAVGSKIEIIVDGGIMRGADVVKAIALGADACMIGKAYLYGLASGGEAGVEKALEILNDEIKRVMALIGCQTMAELSPDVLKRIR